jgi:hypothetical protein
MKADQSAVTFTFTIFPSNFPFAVKLGTRTLLSWPRQRSSLGWMGMRPGLGAVTGGASGAETTAVFAHSLIVHQPSLSLGAWNKLGQTKS